MTENEKQKALSRNVTKANELIQSSRYNLSLQEQKIILYLISQITPYDEDFKLYEFSIQEFCQVCGMDDQSGKNYADIKAAIKNIADKSMWITLEDGDTEALIRWIEKPYLLPRNGTIRIKLDEDLKPYLLQLKENFTSYELIWTLHFKSKYTIRLYEIVKSIHFHELESYEREYSLNELRTMLEADTYTTWQAFKKRALEPAIAEINEYSDKEVSYEALTRKGKTIERIRLHIASKDALSILKVRERVETEMGCGQMSIFDLLDY